MFQVLSPELYGQLLVRFDEVRITNHGQPTEVCYVLDIDGRLRLRVLYYGETYYVNCPYCFDRRKRLAINCLWGSYDPRLDERLLHLVYCYNEGCLARRDAQEQLDFEIFGPNPGKLRYAPAPRIADPAAPPPTIELPASEPLSSLPESHPAVTYVRGRRFDPAKLERDWDVSFCESNTSSRPHFADRLLIPLDALPPTVFVDEAPGPPFLAGWQARSIGARHDRLDAKYLTAAGTRRNSLLYGLPQALEVPDLPLVVVEGVSDAWRVGRGAVALLGKSISLPQVRLIQKHSSGRPVVVLLDDDARAEAETVARSIRAGRDDPVCVARVPPGRKDPGDCTPRETRDAVAAALT